MFGLLHNLFKYIKVSRERRITFVVLGLDAAGKSTLLNTLKGELGKEVAPTFGFKTEEMGEGKYTIVFFDLGGSSSMRKTWKSYLAEVHAVIFVVDAAAPARFSEACTTLGALLENEQMMGKPLLVFANKQDLPTAASPSDIAAALNLSDFKQTKFHILPCTALSAPGSEPDPGLRSGLRWLVSSVDSVYKALSPRVAADTAVVRAEEARKKAERAERARVTREERQREQETQRAEEATADVKTKSSAAPSVHETPLLPMQALSEGTTTSTVVSNMLNSSPDLGPAGAGVESRSSAAGSNAYASSASKDLGTEIHAFSELMGASSAPIPNQIESPKPLGRNATARQRESALSTAAAGPGGTEHGELLYGGIRPHSGRVVPVLEPHGSSSRSSRGASREGVLHESSQHVSRRGSKELVLQ